MKKTAIFALWAILLGGGSGQASVLDAPHNETNGISCGSCHTYSMWWQYSPAVRSGTPGYEAIVNTVCMACHGSSGPAPTVVGHSGAAMASTTYHGGVWSEGCTVCHNPHEQSQINWSTDNVNPFLVTGTIDGVLTDTPAAGETTITYSGKTDNARLSHWPEGSWNDKSTGAPGRGLILVHDRTEAVNTFSVLSATATEIVIQGRITASEISTTTCPQAPNCGGANTFGLLYGQFIRKVIATPAGGERQVKFLDPQGGFVDTATTPATGVCQVCHTQTHYWDSDGGHATHNVGVNCASCHPHQDGFKPGFPPHSTYVGGQGQCTACHTGSDRVLDIHQGICDHCHTTPPNLATPAARANVIAIAPGDCFTCHGSGFAHPHATHSQVTAVASCAACHDTTNIITGVHQANCLGCHGSTLPVVALAIRNKTGGSCTTCHTGTSEGAIAHGTTIDTVAASHDRLVASIICASCHLAETTVQGLALHPDCTTCHASSKSAVIGAISAGRAGTTVSCETCHIGTVAGGAMDHGTTSATAGAAHDLFAASTVCGGCHVSATAEQRLALHTACATCHGSLKSEVSGAISAGLTGTTVSCETCHSGGSDSALTHGLTNATVAPLHDHLSASTSCASCHVAVTAEQRLALHPACTTCHGSPRAEVAAAITSGRTGTVVTCTTCHGEEFTHPHATHSQVTAAPNCAACHGSTNLIAGVHQANCLGCHTSTNQVVIEAIASKSGGTCETCHGVGYPHPFALHLKVTATEQCVVCHVGANLITEVHAGNCAGCHTSTRPFVVQAIANKSGGTCATCHTDSHVGTVDLFMVHEVIGNDCKVCHYPTLAYSPHNNLGTVALCQSCHAGASFEEIVAIHQGSCLKCHLTSDTTKLNAILAGRSNPGTPVTCETCHGASYGHPSATHSKVQAVTECVVCHAGNHVIVDTHKGNCLGCHTSTRPEVRTAIATRNGGTCTTCHVAPHPASINIGTLHYQNEGSVDCGICHYLAYPDLSYSPHNNLGGNAACSSCHSGADFDGILAIHLGDCRKCHLSGLGMVIAVIDAGRGNPGTPAQCLSCHTGQAGAAPLHGTDFAGAASAHDQFAAAPACVGCHVIATAEQRLSLHLTCTTCHSSARRSVIAAIENGRNGILVNCEACHNLAEVGSSGHGLTPAEAATVHNMFGGSSDCASCHLIASTEQRLALHPVCTACHNSANQVVVSAISSGKAGVSIQCTTCHTSGGMIIHGTTMATAAASHDMFGPAAACASCHVITTSEERLTLHRLCTTCHGSTKAAVVTAQVNGRAGIPVNCESCHSGGPGSALTHGTTTAMVAPSHDQFEHSANCAACHVAPVVAQRLDLHQGCLTCHGSGQPSVVATIAGGRAGATITCDNCHDGSANGAPGHGATPASAAQVHDQFGAAATCGGCHLMGTAAERLGLHPACTTCHNSTKSVVVGAITSGRAGIAVSCETCHTVAAGGAITHGTTIPTAAAVHDMLVPAASCSSCHEISTADQRLAIHQVCTTCHASSKDSVRSAIAAGRAGTTVSCETCHDASGSGAPVHGMTPASVAAVHNLFAATPTCSTCHPNGSAEQRISLHKACTTCHNSSRTEVVNAISAGKAGTQVQCSSCHTGSLGAAHHTNPNATSGNCTWCHADPREGWSTMRPGDNGGSSPLPTQLACAQCHVRVVGTTLYIDKLTYGTGTYPYATAPTRTVQHTIDGVSSGSIYNYGMCFSCHNGVTATRVSVFHAKPASGAASNRQSNMANAPGRGTFNLFWGTFHGQEESSFGRESYKSSSSTYQNPAAGFSFKLNVPCGSFNGCTSASTVSVPVLAAKAVPAPAGSTVHDQFSAAASCATCHTATSEAARTTGLHTTCGTCHSNAKGSVVDTILGGINGAAVTCLHCHDHTANGALTHGTTVAEVAAQHNMFMASTSCATCHPTGTVEQRLSLHPDCTTCHASTTSAVINAISSGKAGTQVECVTCHSGNLGTAHHANNPNVASGNCTWCHADPRGGWSTMRPGDNGGASQFPTQLACAKCHVRVSGSTIYVDKIVYANGNYLNAPTRTVQHTISGVTSGYIYNYGMCFSCHNGTRAVQAGVFHAKPASGASGSRYENMASAPGRGTFNLFWSTFHGQEDSSWGRESYKGNDRDFQTSTVSFASKIIPCGTFNGCSGSTTQGVPVLPARAVPPSGNQAPVANNDTYSVSSGSSGVTLNVRANDTDPEGDSLTISSVGTPSNGGTVTTTGTSLTYSPAPGFAGTESFTYTLRDAGGQTDIATVTITVFNGGGSNLPPVAGSDSFAVNAGSSNNTLNVLANDTDPNSDSLTITAVGAPSNGGSVSFTAGTLSYTPAAGCSGTETFSYTVRDPGGLTASATVTVTVGGGATTSVQPLNQWSALANGTAGTFIPGSGSNRLVLVAVHYEFGSTTSNPTLTVRYGGKTLTQIGRSNNTRDDVWLGYLKEADIVGRGNDTVTVTFSSTPTTYTLAAASYAGVDQATPIQGVVVNQVASGGSSANPSFSNLAVSNRGVALYAITANHGAAITPPSGYTERYEVNVNSGEYSASSATKAITATGTETRTLTMASQRWGLVAASLKPAP